jgi:hypothetical protein
VGGGPIKGQCHEIFVYFFHQQFLLVPTNMPWIDLQFSRIFKKFFFICNQFHSVFTTVESLLPTIVITRESSSPVIKYTRESTYISLQKHLLVPNTPESQDSPVINTLSRLDFLAYLAPGSFFCQPVLMLVPNTPRIHDLPGYSS